jgi:hypothetical protein
MKFIERCTKDELKVALADFIPSVFLARLL